MTAQITGFVTRADADLRRPRSFSSKITPQNGGCAPHWGGPTQPAADPGSDHARCLKTWRDWQNYHMDKHKWADIAYTGGFCNHGFAFAGRGFGVRTAANGSNVGNQNFYAFVWIGGEGQTPTKAAYDACDWWIEEARSKGAGSAVKPHRWFKNTGCPGNDFVLYAQSRDNRAVPTPRSLPVRELPPGVDREMTKRVQSLLRVDVDGLWGAETDGRADLMITACRSRVGWPKNDPQPHHKEGVQHIIGAVPNGNFNLESQRLLHLWVRNLQRAINVYADGLWGPETDAAFAKVRQLNRGQF